MKILATFAMVKDHCKIKITVSLVSSKNDLFLFQNLTLD